MDKNTQTLDEQLDQIAKDNGFATYAELLHAAENDEITEKEQQKKILEGFLPLLPLPHSQSGNPALEAVQHDIILHVARLIRIFLLGYTAEELAGMAAEENSINDLLANQDHAEIAHEATLELIEKISNSTRKGPQP